MLDVLTALLAFVAEHQRCGDLDGGRDDARVPRPLPRVAPPRDSAVVRSLLAAPSLLDDAARVGARDGPTHVPRDLSWRPPRRAARR